MLFRSMCAARNFSATRLGVVDSEAALEPALVIDNVYGETVMLPLTELAEKHFGTLPAVFGPTVG